VVLKFCGNTEKNSLNKVAIFCSWMFLQLASNIWLVGQDNVFEQ